MKRFLIILIGIIAWWALLYSATTFAATLIIPSGDTIKGSSILVDASGWDAVTVGQAFGLRILNLLKVVVSGFALVFMVMVGVYMVVFSENEERVKTQRKQIVYILIGFLFLNVPWVVYDILSPADASGEVIGMGSYTETWIFWYQAGLPGFVGDLVGFFRVFAYGAAILMLTWGFFRMILSSGDEEQVKSAKSRIIYSLLALVFLLFIDIWIRMVSGTSLSASVPGVASILFRLALFFAAPTAIFFLIYGAYYYITSAGDEERIKKGKNILLNTFIASLILIASFSFLTDLISFTF